MAITIDGAGTITGLDADGISAQPVFPGNVLQVVTADILTSVTTSSTSFVDTGLGVNITPTFSSSKILLLANATVGHSANNIQRFVFARNGAVINNGTGGFGAVYAITAVGPGVPGQQGYPWSMIYVDSPNSTSAIDYDVYFSTDAATVTFNTRGTGTNPGRATLIAMEIAG